MGYETMLLVGKDTGQTYLGDDQGSWFQIYAMVDMCKLGNSELFNMDWVNKDPDGRWSYWYAPTGDGDTHVVEDCYGDKPRPVPIGKVIDALRCDILTDDGYRRLHWALALLENMQETANEELQVLMYGY